MSNSLQPKFHETAAFKNKINVGCEKLKIISVQSARKIKTTNYQLKTEKCAVGPMGPLKCVLQKIEQFKTRKYMDQ